MKFRKPRLQSNASTYKPRKVKMKESPEAEAIENKEGLPVGDPDYMEFMESREG